MGLFNKILIANRGEIAARIIRTVKAMGIQTVAVYAVDDAHSLHVSMADESILLDGNSLAETYLNQKKIIQISLDHGVDAIHPGYGFLSENAGFAKQVEQVGITFIGATSSQIKLMGEKSIANEFVQKLAIPVVPRIDGKADDILDFAKNFTFPLLVKASAGGGGKGMFVVNQVEDLEIALKTAQRQAGEYFGNDEIFVEKYLPNVRHIEVQIFGDGTGNAVHLFERECSIQRRYQKLIEEAPAVSISKELKQMLYVSALEIAESTKYKGAGTVEFLVDENEDFYFLEMNTRLQVEHPVTEMITDIDLVEWQIRIAGGEGLPLAQSDIKQTGHAIELRVCAENPMEDFIPTSGKIVKVKVPKMDNFRFESFVSDGYFISSNYDSLLAKVVVWEKDREAAISKMISTAGGFVLSGIKTNWAFLQQILKNKCFFKNEINTRFVEDKLELIDNGFKNEHDRIQKLIPAIAYLFHHFVTEEDQVTDLWSKIGFWRANQSFSFYVDEVSVSVDFQRLKDRFTVTLDDLNVAVSNVEQFEDRVSFKLDRKVYHVTIIDLEHTSWVQYNEHDFMVRSNHLQEQIVLERKLKQSMDKGHIRVHADLFGKIIGTSVKPGDRVVKNQLLLTIESMKTEFSVLSPSDGIVKDVYVEAGNLVEDRQLLVEFEVKNEITINA